MNTVIAEHTDITNWYVNLFNEFSTNLNGNKARPFWKLRNEAIQRFRELGFPGRKNEDWKYTSLKQFVKHEFQLADVTDIPEKKDLAPFTFPNLEERVLVFVNGHFTPHLSTFQVENGKLIVTSLKTAMVEHPSLVEQYLGKYLDYQNQTFPALNIAFITDGAFIYLPEGFIEEQPIHIMHVNTTKSPDRFCNPHHLIVAERNSEVKIVESYHSLTEKTYFTNLVTEVILHEDARVEHVKIQDESRNAFHIATVQAEHIEKSVYTLTNIDMGGGLARNNINIVLNAPYSESHLYGFYLAGDRQHVDNHTLIDHAQPNCESNETYRGILGGRATGVFNGKVMVRPHAQKTNAYQSNKALLLSDDATVNSKPELEIYADDVKCSHGATVGQLDPEALFYLRARGIPEQKAYSILQHAFAIDIFENISISSVREKLEAILPERFEQL